MRTLRDMVSNLFHTRHAVACDWHWANSRRAQIRMLIAEIRAGR